MLQFLFWLKIKMPDQTFLDNQRKAGKRGRTCGRLMVFVWLIKRRISRLRYMNRVMELALFHDMGEALTGDIPAFERAERMKR